VNNCVGILNQKYFLQFLFYTVIACVYGGGLLVARFISCSRTLRMCSIYGWQIGLAAVTAAMALVFGLFVSIMIWDQLCAIFENTPGIDALKQIKGVQKGKYESLCSVFGTPFSWRWFFPLEPELQVIRDLEEELMQLRMVYVRSALPSREFNSPGPASPASEPAVPEFDLSDRAKSA